MDYKKLVKSQVKKAFARVGTLATSVSFERRTATSFDFGTQTANQTAPETVVFKGIPLEDSAKGSKPTSTITKKMLFITDEIGNPDIYDKATIDGFVWKPVPPSVSDGYTTTVTFTKDT